MKWVCVCCLGAGFFLGEGATPTYAQGYPPNRKGGGIDARPGNKRDERGTVTGQVAWLRVDQSAKKDATISVKPVSGPQMTFVLTPQTQYAADKSEWTGEKVKRHLAAGVPVELNWEYWEKVDGRVISDIRIRTVAIKGVIKSANAKKIVVEATPQEPEPEPEPIRVQGRRPEKMKEGTDDKTVDPRTQEKKPPKPRKLTLTVDADTRITLNDKEMDKASALKAKMEFDAVVLDGGSGMILEINARDGSDPRASDDDKPTKNKEPAAKKKKDKDAREPG